MGAQRQSFSTHNTNPVIARNPTYMENGTAMSSYPAISSPPTASLGDRMSGIGQALREKKKLVAGVALVGIAVVAVGLGVATATGGSSGGGVDDLAATGSSGSGEESATEQVEQYGPAGRDERCTVTGIDKFALAGHELCQEGLECVATEFYSQCVGCNEEMFNEDCGFWTMEFKDNAMERCQRDTCTPPDHGCADIDDPCAMEAGDEFMVGKGYDMCRRGLVCTKLGDHTQCVDCNENWNYDCPHWTPEFLGAAQDACGVERACEPPPRGERECDTDSDCSNGDKCVSTCNFSQCVSCTLPQYNWDCGYWVDPFLTAAKDACGGIECVPEVCPDKYRPTSSPTLSPTSEGGGDGSTPFPTASWPAPTASPTTSEPTTSEPTMSPTISPTTSGSADTPSPTMWPAPTEEPTASPTKLPTTSEPTASPTKSPTTSEPTASPTKSPTTSEPTASPTKSPTTSEPTASPTKSPTASPTKSPTTSAPTASPTLSPTPTREAPPTPFPTGEWI